MPWNLVDLICRLIEVVKMSHDFDRQSLCYSQMEVIIQKQIVREQYDVLCSLNSRNYELKLSETSQTVKVSLAQAALYPP